MLAYVIRYGVIAGVVAGGALTLTVLTMEKQFGWVGMAIGYAIMLVALSAVFVAVKRYRDVEGGGVIGFWRAFGLGVAISAIAGVVYAFAWEIGLALSGEDFMAAYTEAMLAEQRAAGASGAQLAQTRSEMAAMAESYANPLFRLPMTFSEIFPVGILVSLVSAAILRNPRALPAQPA